MTFWIYAYSIQGRERAGTRSRIGRPTRLPISTRSSLHYRGAATHDRGVRRDGTEVARRKFELPFPTAGRPI